MSIFDPPLPDASWEENLDRLRRIQQYLCEAPDPNESGSDGRTLLLLALYFCSTPEGEEVVINLLNRGADPNKPSAWTNFTTLMMASNSLKLVEQFVAHGLRLNDVYDVNHAGGLCKGPSTLLDYVHQVGNRISSKRKGLNSLASKHVGGLSGRRRFVEQTIALLESNGARLAADFA